MPATMEENDVLNVDGWLDVWIEITLTTAHADTSWRENMSQDIRCTLLGAAEGVRTSSLDTENATLQCGDSGAFNCHCANPYTKTP